MNSIKLAPAPVTYDDLRSDTEIVPLPPVPPVGPAGSSIIDPTFGTTILRETDAHADATVRNWNTPSGPNLNGWSSDGAVHYVGDDDGGVYLLYDRTGQRVGAPLAFLSEPCFARVPSKPTTLYAPHYGYVFTAFDYVPGTRTTLLNVQDDVGPLSQDPSPTYPSGSYLSSIYASTTPERVAGIYGDIQEAHRYMTVCDVDDPARRCTVNVQTSQLKVNGRAWEPLLLADGTRAHLDRASSVTGEPVRLHSCAIDRSGDWVKLDLSGDYGGPFHVMLFHVPTRRLHEWTSPAWGGHYSFGFRQHVSCIADPHGGSQLQWLLTDLTKPGAPPPWLALIVPPPQGDHDLGDHNSWNNVDATNAQPFISATQRMGMNTKWGLYYEELVAVGTSAVDPSRVWRIAHHRAQTVKDGIAVASFRDSPRPQVSPDGRLCAFTSNWSCTLGTLGTPPANYRRDVFLVDLSREAPPVQHGVVCAHCGTTLQYCPVCGHREWVTHA